MGLALSDVHGLLALAGLLGVVGSFIALRRSQVWTGQLSGFAAVVLLITVVSGVVLWVQGFRPASGWLSWLHVLLGIGALAHALMALRRRPPETHRHTLALASIMALLALLIGHLS